MLLLLALACAPDEPKATPADPVETPEAPLPRCGDGVLDADEACDDGAANSDADPDACRATCLLPACGDGVVDGGEACDDGGLDGGDGCDGACVVEAGTLEVEPNDAPDEATATSAVGGARVHGSLPDGDTDCYSFDVAQCEAVRVSQVGPCTTALTMALYDPAGALLATGAPGEDGCAALEPADQPGARWVSGGAWSVCITHVGDAVAPSYALDVTTVASATLDADPGDDSDADSQPDSCDLDADGDGVPNDTDNCPDVSNGPDTTLTLGPNGYIRTWIGAGPFEGDATTLDCRPAEEPRVGEDGDFAPSIGDPAGDFTWRGFLLTTDSFDLLGPYGYVPAAREAYTMVWLWSDTARDATLSVGADDGVFAWWNGEKVMDISSCQGVNLDQFQADVAIDAGWNGLLLKVRDQGGGWGLVARLLGPDGAAITDLTPGLDPEGVWRPDQSDADGDGLGDVCDEG